jgi:hypothetical protein
MMGYYYFLMTLDKCHALPDFVIESFVPHPLSSLAVVLPDFVIESFVPRPLSSLGVVVEECSSRTTHPRM